MNILAIAMLLGGFFYLDNYRTRAMDARIETIESQLLLLERSLEAARPGELQALVLDFTESTKSRLRFYSVDGKLSFDSFQTSPPTYTLRDPTLQPWERNVARAMDRGIDWFVGAPSYPEFEEPEIDHAAAWPEVREVQMGAESAVRMRYAAERTPLISVVRMLDSDQPQAMLMTVNARDITRTVRAERLRAAIIVGLVLSASITLSLFLARRIVRPLRRLARAAVKVRLGRAREVEVPRMAHRIDEIGTLARAISDMTEALRERIDAGEHFAADVTHELKNPIASMRSAIEGLSHVKTDEHRAQLLGIAQEDVQRLDRLVTDISDASRIDAQLSRTHFEPIDIGLMIEAMLAGRAIRQVDGEPHPRVAFARPRKRTTLVMGDGHRLERALDNIIDNAIGFSPIDGLVTVRASLVGDHVQIRVDDDGPGIDPSQREDVFRRFHSVRSGSDNFGRHSGLGLAIARTIIEGHGGTISVEDREDGEPGASLMIRLPACSTTQTAA